MSARRKDPTSREPGPTGALPEELLLLDQLRRGDAEAGRRFVRDYYPPVYHYLLYLTGRADRAEDLAQETFLQAWRHLDRLVLRAPLRAWLHRIAHREFLQALRSQRAEVSLEAIGEAASPAGSASIEAVELREVIGKLPVEERETVILHYLEGYNCGEIARIVGASASMVKYRLAMARSRLQRELGEGDLCYLNELSAPMRQWAWLPLDQMYALEARLAVPGQRPAGRGDRAAPGSGAGQEEPMERREFLRQAAAGAAGLMLSETEKEIVDSRLTQKVTCAFKGAALSDVCDHLHTDTGIQLTAGPSVADEKITLFCEKLPLREVMRQLSRPFGYTWLRSGSVFGIRSSVLGKDADPNTQHRTPNTDYRYELVQDLRSQILEEELRNRDRNAALIALDQEIERYRRFLDLSPDEARARARTASAEDRPLLERLAGKSWGPIQMYFRLSPGDVQALRAGRRLDFKQEPGPGEQPLPPEVALGVLQSLPEVRLREDPAVPGRVQFGSAQSLPDGLPPVSFPKAGARVRLQLTHTELGQFTLEGECGVYVGTQITMPGGELASGMNPVARNLENERLNAQWGQDPALRARVSIIPQPSCRPTPRAGSAPPPASEARVTSADVLEALHRASGLLIVADYYTRLRPADQVSLRNVTLFDALNRLSATMGLRWTRDKEAGWLQFRSVTYYDDRLKEIPDRLLARWSASRREHGGLTLDDLVEIAQLSDVQLNSGTVAEGARDCFGLQEWDLARSQNLRPHLRYLAGLSPDQRQVAMSAAGLPFSRLSRSQQQQLAAHLGERLPSLEALSEIRIRVEYIQPGEFQWVQPGMSDFQGPNRPWPANFFELPAVRGRTREAVLQAARRIDPNLDPAQVRPTELWLAILYRRVDPQTANLTEWGYSGTVQGGRGNW